MTVLAVNAFTAASTAAATAEMIAALQGSAAQISGNVRGALVGQAMIAEALSSQDTQRLVESDRIAAMKAHQFSTTLCQEATGVDITIAQAVAAQTDQVLASRANAHRTGGYLDLPGKSGERFSVYAASASKRHGLLYPRAECRLTGL